MAGEGEEKKEEKKEEKPPEPPPPAAMDDDDDDDDEDGPEPEPELTLEEKGELLIAACKAGDGAETSRLILEDAPLQHEDAGGWTSLLWASCNGHEECAASLITAGAAAPFLAGPPVPEEVDANGTVAVRPRKGKKQEVVNSPIHWAAFKGHLAIVWKLLHSNVSHEHVDAQGNTALHLAAAGGHVSIILCLLNHGADLLARNFFCNTCMDVGRERPEVKAALKVLTSEKTFNVAEIVVKGNAPAVKTGMRWNELKLMQEPYPTTRVLCTGAWCRQSGEVGPGNLMGRFFSTKYGVVQDVLDRVPTDSGEMPPHYFCQVRVPSSRRGRRFARVWPLPTHRGAPQVCMEQIKEAELALRHGMENKSNEGMGAQIETLVRQQTPQQLSTCMPDFAPAALPWQVAFEKAELRLFV